MKKTDQDDRPKGSYAGAEKNHEETGRELGACYLALTRVF